MRATFQHGEWTLKHPEVGAIRFEQALVRGRAIQQDELEVEVIRLHGVNQQDVERLSPKQLRDIGLGAIIGREIQPYPVDRHNTNVAMRLMPGGVVELP